MASSVLSRKNRGALSELIRVSGFIFACRIFGAVAAFATQVLLARSMGASELGIYVLAFSWCILLSTLSTGGFRLAAIRFIGEGLARDGAGYIHGFMRRSRQFVVIVSLVVGVGGSLTLLMLPQAYGPESRDVYVIALLAVPLFALLNLYSGFANALSRFPLSVLPNTVLRPLLFLAGIVAIWLTEGVLDARISIGVHWFALAIVTAITIFYSHFAFQKVTLDQVPEYDTRLWIRTSLPLLIVALYTGYFPELMVIIVGAFVSIEDVAIFHVCFRVAMLISFGLYAVDAFSGPQITALLTSGDRVELQRAVNRITRLKFSGAVAALIVLAVTGRWVLGIFGEEFVVGYPILMLLASAQLVQAVGGTVIRLITMSGHQDSSLIVFGVATLVALGLVAVLVPSYGLTGAAVAVVLNTLLWVAWTRHLVVRYLNIHPSIF
jgi:O-antigen/teichoic acid export membrane protein